MNELLRLVSLRDVASSFDVCLHSFDFFRLRRILYQRLTSIRIQNLLTTSEDQEMTGPRKCHYRVHDQRIQGLSVAIRSLSIIVFTDDFPRNMYEVMYAIACGRGLPLGQAFEQTS